MLAEQFEEGSLLFYWYDNWIILIGLLVAIYFTFRVLFKTPWTRPIWLLARLVSLGAVAVLVVVTADRIGIELVEAGDWDADAIGFLSIVSAALPTLLGIYALIFVRRRTPDYWKEMQRSPGPEPEESRERGPVDFAELADEVADLDGADLEPEPMEEAEEPTRPQPAPAGASSPPVGSGPGDSGGILVLDRVSKAPAWLLVSDGPQSGEMFDLTTDRTVVGRAPDCDVVLEDPKMADQHAEITVRESRYLLTDLGTAAGTWVNDQSVGGAVLGNGSRLRVGTTELYFTEVGAGAETDSEAVPDDPSGEGQDPEASDDSGTQVLDLGVASERRSTTGSSGVLVVRSGTSAGQRHSLTGDELTIGREPGDDGMTVDDPAVSRRHALIRRSGGTFHVYDLGSANGTSVDGVDLSGKQLENGDIVRFGDTRVEFVEAAAG